MELSENHPKFPSQRDEEAKFNRLSWQLRLDLANIYSYKVFNPTPRFLRVDGVDNLILNFDVWNHFDLVHVYGWGIPEEEQTMVVLRAGPEIKAEMEMYLIGNGGRSRVRYDFCGDSIKRVTTWGGVSGRLAADPLDIKDIEICGGILVRIRELLRPFVDKSIPKT